MRVENEEDKGEGDLSSAGDQLMYVTEESNLHVKNTVSDDLGVDRDLVGSLGQSPDDGVSGPKTGRQFSVGIHDTDQLT